MMSEIATHYDVIQVDGTVSSHVIDWPHEPGYKKIKALVDPLLGAGEPLEHVSVLHDGKRKDMFVSELGHVELTTRRPLPINATATKIYRAAALSNDPGAHPDELPDIAGVAILFHRIVWM